MHPILTLNDPFTLFIVAVASILIVGYLIGRATNRRYARAISTWLEPSLRSLGGTPVIQAVSRTAFRVKVMQARAPFHVVTATTVLLSREVLPIWLWERIQRHSDVVFFHLTLRRNPHIRFEIVNVTSELGRRGRSQAQKLQWPLAREQNNYHLYCPADVSSDSSLQRLFAHATDGPFTPHRVAVRTDAPHVLVSFSFSDLQRVSSVELVRWLTALVRLLPLDEGREMP